MNSRHVDVPNGNMLNTLSNERIVNRLAQLPEQAVVLQYPLRKGIQHPDSAENLFPATSERLPVVRAETHSIDAAQRLALLCELPKQFETEPRLDELFQTLLEQIIEVIPGACYGALLLRDRESDALLLKAYISSNGPHVNKQLVRRAMSEGKGFIQTSGEQGEENTPMTGLYVPLIWQGDALGVLCLNNPQQDANFTEEDLQIVSTVAYYAAAALANRQLQEEMRQTSKQLDRLLTNFSPKIGKKLLERARHGKLRPGGKKSEVTILYADIRGFTRMSAGLDAEDIVEILNTYFSPLIKSIFACDGTIDKFIGDAILAVFGSPEPDANQHKKAVQAAWEMLAAVQELNARRNAQGQVTCEIGIGIHCGEVLHGFIGSAEQVEFTVIGDAVNRASRYCDGAEAGEVLISPEVYQRVWEMVQEERTSTETKHEGPLAAYRITGVNV